jgi:hypothetical protein
VPDVFEPRAMQALSWHRPEEVYIMSVYAQNDPFWQQLDGVIDTFHFEEAALATRQASDELDEE